MPDRPETTDELPAICPKCGSDTILGYGFAGGGGLGAYVICDGDDSCDFFSKKADVYDDEACSICGEAQSFSHDMVCEGFDAAYLAMEEARRAEK